MSQRYPFVVVDVTEEEADEASALLFELGATGIEQRDAATLAFARPGGAPVLPPAEAAGGEVGIRPVRLIASFDDEEGARTAAGEVPEAWSPRIEETVGDAWRDEWKKYFEPFRVCEGIVVCPPWREYTPERGERVIVLEPGRAFGTGLHETTSLVAEVLAQSPLAGATVLDVGCGSGILSLVALALGAAEVRAIDVDPDAVAVTRENAQRNSLDRRVVADDAPIHSIADRYPLVLANIEAKTLIEMAPPLAASVAPGGLLVLSGILAADVVEGQVQAVRSAFAPMKEESLRRKGEWVALVMRKPSAP